MVTQYNKSMMILIETNVVVIKKMCIFSALKWYEDGFRTRDPNLVSELSKSIHAELVHFKMLSFSSIIVLVIDPTHLEISHTIQIHVNQVPF